MPDNRAPYKIIFSSGISILRNLKEKFSELPEGRETNYLTNKRLDSIGPSKYELSAEISLMNALEVGLKDESVLLTTNTESGKRAAAIVKHVAKKLWNGCHVEIVETAVELDDAEQFKRSGLPDFIKKLDDIVSKSKSEGFDPVISVSAGINHVLPYLTFYGMMHRLTCAYVYELRNDTHGRKSRSSAQRLVRLPRLPLSFDYEALRIGADVLGALDVLDHIEENISIPTFELKKRLGDRYDTLEGLFEPIGDNEVTMSAFGFLLNDFRKASNTKIQLSRKAQKVLEQLKGQQKREMKSMLEEARNALWRDSHIHPLTGIDTDILVYKDSLSTRRIAGWTTADSVHVVELFITKSQYDSYVDTIKSKKRDDYRTEVWVELSGAVDAKSILSDEVKRNMESDEIEKLETSVDELSKRNEDLELQNMELTESKETIEKDMTSLTSRIEGVEAERDRATSKLAVVEAERDKATAVARQLSEMSMLQRLRWCFTGRRRA